MVENLRRINNWYIQNSRIKKLEKIIYGDRAEFTIDHSVAVKIMAPKDFVLYQGPVKRKGNIMVFAANSDKPDATIYALLGYPEGKTIDLEKFKCAPIKTSAAILQRIETSNNPNYITFFSFEYPLNPTELEIFTNKTTLRY